MCVKVFVQVQEQRRNDLYYYFYFEAVNVGAINYHRLKIDFAIIGVH